MKYLLSGNEAIARGVYEAGVKVCAAYPGTPSTEIFETLPKYSDSLYCEWAPNEKVAVEMAYGASIAGARSFSAMKHVGLNVAADPVFTAAYNGVGGGFVIVTADDPSLHSSQNEQDNRWYALHAKVPCIEPSDSQECKDFVKEAFAISEKFDMPVLLRTTTRVSHSKSLVELGERVETEVPAYQRNAAKFTSTPANAYRNRTKLENNMRLLEEYSNESPLQKVEIKGSKVGVIAASIAYEYAKDVFPEDTSFLKIGLSYPLPMKLISDFAAKVEKLYVVEELDGFMEAQIKAAGIDCVGKDLVSNMYELNPQLLKEQLFGIKPETVDVGVKPVPRPPALCPGCPHRGFFYTMSKNKNYVIAGDIGCYTLGSAPPLMALDSTLCMGASISGLHGFNKVGGQETEKKSVCVIGDSTFMHSGMTDLVNIAYNASNSTVIILDNSITGMTGHQQNPTTGYNIKGDPAAAVNLEELCTALGIHRVRVVDPYNLQECEDVILEEMAVEEPSVIISRRPCMLLKYVKPKAPVKIKEDKCVGCKSCLKIGCPAVSFKNGKAVIDNSLCVGCEVCTQMCRVGAIERGE